MMLCGWNREKQGGEMQQLTYQTLPVPHAAWRLDGGLALWLPITEAADLDKVAYPTGHTLQGMWEYSQPPLTLAWMEDGAADDMCREWEAEWSMLVSHSTGAWAHKHTTYNDKLSAWIHHAFTLLLSPIKMQREETGGED